MKQYAGTVVFDIDDTLGNFASAFARFMHHEYGTDPKDHLRWKGSIKEHYYMPEDKFLAALHKFDNQGWMRKMSVVQSVVDQLWNYYGADYYIQILTARSWMVDGFKKTEKWLTKKNIPYNELTLVEMSQCKASHISTRGGPVHAVFDDNKKHALAISEAHPFASVYLIDRPWNQDVDVWKYQGLYRFNPSLSEISVGELEL